MKKANENPAVGGHESDTGQEVGIAELREQVDAIDDEIIRLISERIRVSSLIMQRKSAASVIDPAREQIIADRYFEKLADLSTQTKTKRLVSSIIGASKIYPD